MLNIDPKPEADLSIAVMTNDPPEVLAHFAAAHLVQGVKRIFMFFDNPENPFIPIAQVHPQIIATVCDDAFWANTKKGRRPTYVETRQFICYRLAYLRAETKWIGFVDADEILYSENGFDLDLAAAGEKVQAIRAHVCEAVWPEAASEYGAFSGTLARTHLDNPLEELPYGERFSVASSKGMIGHKSGKYIVRTGIPGVFPGIHVPRVFSDDRKTKTKIKCGWFDYRIRMIHYDAVSFDAWQRKHERRVSGQTAMIGNPKHRDQQTEMFANLTSEGDRLTLFKELYCMSDVREKIMRERNALFDINTSQDVFDLKSDLLQRANQFAS